MDATREALRIPPQEPVRDAADAGDERRYPLFLAEGEMRLYWRLDDNGLTLRNGRLIWTADGVGRDFTFDDIRGIRLQHAAAEAGEAIGLCQIRFRNGVVVNIYGGGDQGVSDAAQAAHYSAFVRDLHARIPEAAARRIGFHAGLSDTRHTIVTAATILGGLLFIGTPLVLLFVVPATEMLKVLGLLGAGAAFCWPMYKLWENNRPHRYSPRDLPEDLLG